MVGSCLGWPKYAILIATRSYGLETCYMAKMIFDTLFTFSQIRRIEKTLRRTLESLPEVYVSSYMIAFSSLKCIVYNAIIIFYVQV